MSLSSWCCSISSAAPDGRLPPIRGSQSSPHWARCWGPTHSESAHHRRSTHASSPDPPPAVTPAALSPCLRCVHYSDSYRIPCCVESQSIHKMGTARQEALQTPTGGTQRHSALGMDNSSMALPELSILRGITTGIAIDRQAAAS